MARKGSSAAIWPWVYQGGSSRRYRNEITGDTISREKYDRYYGSLFRRGATSFKSAARATPEELRLSRPARGRGARSVREDYTRLRNIRPLIGRQSRNINLPFEVYYDEDEGSLFEEAEEYRDGYESAVELVHKNPAISAVSLIVTYENTNTGKSGNYTIRRIEDKWSLATYDEFLDDLTQKAYPGDLFTRLTFHLRFFDQFTRKKVKPVIGLTLPPNYRQVKRVIGR